MDHWNESSVQGTLALPCAAPSNEAFQHPQSLQKFLTVAHKSSPWLAGIVSFPTKRQILISYFAVTALLSLYRVGELTVGAAEGMV